MAGGGGGLGFGSGFASGLMQAMGERRQRKREDEHKASEQNWRKLQLLFPVALKEGQETGDFTLAEQLLADSDPEIGKKMKKEGSPFQRLGSIFGMGREQPFISEEGAGMRRTGASSPPPVVNTQARPATPAEQMAAPGAPAQIEQAAVPWRKRPTLMGVAMSTPEERAERQRQMDRSKLTGDIRTRRDVGSTELGLAGRDLQEFAATGDISSLRTATPPQAGSLASQILMTNEERAAKGQPPMTAAEVGEFRTKYEAQNDATGQRTEFGQYYDDWLRDQGKTRETATAGDRLTARREFMGANRRQDMTPGEHARFTRTLRQDFVRETRASKESMRQIDVMQKALARSKAGDRVAGDQAIISTFNRMIEPDSVTMISEYARTPQAVALVDRAREALRRIGNGGSGVPVAELESMVALAEQFAEEQAAMGNDVATEIAALAKEYKIDPALVTREFVVPSRDKTGTAKPAVAGAPAKPSTVPLPDGFVIGPDGKPKIAKPAGQ